LSNTADKLSANEEMVNQKLAALKRQINRPPPAVSVSERNNDPSASRINQLQAELRQMSNSSGTDPQIAQLSRMLDKIQEIQNPGLVREKMQQQSQKNQGKVYPVTTVAKEFAVSTLDSGTLPDSIGGTSANGFFSFDNSTVQDESQNTIEAVVHQTQTLVNGATVKLRLVNDIYINGILIPKNNFVYGTAELKGERLEIKVNSIRYHKSLFPVNLAVYDMDGLDGIDIPGAITRDVAKESADQSVQNLGLTSYDPSLGAQAAEAGLTAAKTLFSRKVRLVRVTVKAGYEVLLKDEKQKPNN
jgi:conjugative transposon TraM protein